VQKLPDKFQGTRNYPSRKKLTKPKITKRNLRKEEYADLFANPYTAAQRGFVDEVILPQDT
jgi:acetyl-CoA carboxylase carboxyltransferase component